MNSFIRSVFELLSDIESNKHNPNAITAILEAFQDDQTLVLQHGGSPPMDGSFTISPIPISNEVKE